MSSEPPESSLPLEGISSNREIGRIRGNGPQVLQYLREKLDAYISAVMGEPDVTKRHGEPIIRP